LSLGFSLCTTLLPTKQDKPWWTPSLNPFFVDLVCRFQSPIPFFGPGKKNLVCEKNDTDPLLFLFFSSQQDGLLIPFVLDIAAFGLMLSLRIGTGATLFLIRKLQHA
jgi:hypothetical protein